MKHPVITYCLFLTAAILAVSCAEEECTNLDDPRLVLEFKTQYLDTISGRLRDRDTSLAIRNVYGLGQPVPRDTMYSTKSLILPLSQLRDETAFVIAFGRRDTTINDTLVKQGWTDTIAVQYRRQSFFVSDVCGFNVKFKDLTLDTLQTTFPKDSRDSIVIVKNVVDEANTPNLRLYVQAR